MGFSYTTKSSDESSGRGLLPVGDYDARIIKSDDMISKTSGKDMIRLELDTGKGHLWYYLVDGDEYVGAKIASILASAGIFAPNMRVDSTTFRGLAVRVRVKHERYNNELSAKVDRFLPGGGAKTPPPAAPGSDDIPF